MNIRLHKYSLPMSHKNIALLPIGVFLLSSVSSCALLDKSQKLIMRGSSGNSTEETLQSDASDSKVSGPVLSPPKNKQQKNASASSTSGKAVKNKHNKKGGGVSKKELAAARRDAEVNGALEKDNETNSANGKIEDPASGKSAGSSAGDFSIGGEWTIYKVRNNMVQGEERPYVTFDISAKRIYGSNGFNYINGDIKLQPDGKISVENLISTQRLCNDAPLEHLINLALSDVASYLPRQEGSVTYLDLMPANGTVPLIILRRQNMIFLNGAWKVKSLNGTPFEGDVSLSIDVEGRKIHGNTGCNVFNGTLFIDPDKTDSMQFLDLVTTRTACPLEMRETELLLALEEAESARASSPGITDIYSADGDLLLTLERMAVDHREETSRH